MTDHAARSRALMAAGYATDAKTEALLAIASAIRDATPEPTQADTPDQYKPGGVVLSATEHQTLLARAEKAEAERDCWQQRAREAEAAQDLLAEERDEWRARAEKAEAERDAIIYDLQVMRGETAATAHGSLAGEYSRSTARRMLGKLDRILDRHTPEG